MLLLQIIPGAEDHPHSFECGKLGISRLREQRLMLLARKGGAPLMTTFEKRATIIGLLIGFSGVVAALLPDQPPPPQLPTNPPVSVNLQREEDPEMKRLLKAVLAKLAEDGKTLETQPSVSRPISVPSRAKTAAPSARPVREASPASPQQTASADTRSASTTTHICRIVTTTVEKDGLRHRDERPYCRAADGSWAPAQPGSLIDVMDAYRAAESATKT